MRILFVSPFLPYPPVAGGHRQIWSWLRRLAREHEVAFVGFFEREQEAAGAAEIEGLCAETRVRLRQPTPHAYNSFAQMPQPAAEFFSGDLAKDVAAVARDFRPEVVQFLASNMAQYQRWVGNVPWVATALDIAFVAHRRAIAAGRGPERLRARCEWLRMLRYEAAAFRRADHVIAMSEHDAAIIASVARHGRVTAVPPGVDGEELEPQERDPLPGSVLYVGHMEHYPNLDGLLYLYRNIWPHIRHGYPRTKLTVAGGGAREELRREAPETLARMERDASVEVAAFVADLRELMRRTAVMAAPMRLGSGVRNKVIEAMAAGLPVVTTRLGAEGLRAAHEREVLIADGPRELAHQVVRLLKDAELRERLAEAGRELVARDHNNDRLAKRLEHTLARAAGARA